MTSTLNPFQATCSITLFGMSCSSSPSPLSRDDILKQDFCHINKDLYTNPANRPTFTVARFFLNGPKNRYRNILPPDQTRVQLEGEKPTNYINANYIRGFGNLPKQYISAQAPLLNLRANTLGDWWSMIDSEDISVIFMLTRIVEKGKTKATPYWPKNVGEKKQYGNFIVHTLEQNTRQDNIIERNFLMVHNITGKQRHVMQVHYKGWPDFGKPSSVHGFKQLIRYMDDFASTKSQARSPILVHCSAGVGRSGTLIASHVAWQQLREQGANAKINIREIVKELRKDRTGMVQCFLQYQFIYDVINELQGDLKSGQNTTFLHHSASAPALLSNSSPLRNIRASQEIEMTFEDDVLSPSEYTVMTNSL
eukprot:TRINITY_DN2838_c0_g2_i1.p1 TRINITY_DN2838_c0_g2~~TRINITY_DN2838_c0_g2_i1.p1  ORF type:complete len:366 (+),score=45.39 TRINITY_DN2838_c0_g2_i1:87-1184(+)